ncbi:MAG: kinase/pyrophosphorylase [Alphaproteobacteria bacterium]|nr:kinase/pyrophosphorylase [Alphaproteobacteria bacterium]
MPEQIYHLHLISDATGETINALAQACLAQFDAVKVRLHYWNLIRSTRQLAIVLEGLKQYPGPVLYSFVDEEMRNQIEMICRNMSLRSVSALDPTLKMMAAEFGIDSAHIPGRQHSLDKEYFARIEAMEFALAQDDGQNMEKMYKADVLLLGVSRTSKTPTCLYLANRGIKAANIPLIPGQEVPVDLSKMKDTLLIGLTKDPHQLVEIRKNRVDQMGAGSNTAYIDIEAVQAEVQEARRLFTRHGCFVIDVTARSIEETAAEILMLLNRRADTPPEQTGRTGV